MHPLPTFIGSLCRNPSQIGCIAPSSPALARRIASLVDPASPSVIEIGAGTGAVTKALLDRGVAPEKLFAVELDARLAAYLRQQFPDVRVICGDASRLREMLPRDLWGQVDSVVSSLPLRNMRPEVRHALISSALHSLAPNGQLIQFTYRFRCPVPNTGVPVTSERVQRIWNNMPPATVWRFRKKSTLGVHCCG